MKKTFSYLTLVFAILVSITACNNKNDFDFEAAQKEQQKRDSLENIRVKGLIEKQAAELKAFATEKLPGATLIDSLGIWFRVDANGQEDSYTYRPHPAGGLVAPEVKVSYKGTLLNGSVFDQTDEKETSRTFSLAGVIRAWQIAFFPKQIKYNGSVYSLLGLTETGLKKGSKIKFATSSPWGYDTRELKDKEGKVTIPANSPLYFEIEVIDIK